MARLRHLVVIVPGIGGSVLAEPGSPAAVGADSTVGIKYGLSARGLAQPMMAPSTLRSDRELVPVGLVRDMAVLPPLWTLPGYQRQRLHLHNSFRGDPPLVISTFRPETGQPVDPATDVLVVPYDFRLSIVDSARRLGEAVTVALAARDTASGAGASDGQRVIVVAHSLGGLVARQWIASGEGWRLCRALITAGTPYRGAPKALDWLVNGAGVTGLRHPGLTGALRGWPSMYELLPQYDAVWDEAAGVSVEVKALPEPLLAARPRLRSYAQRFTAMAAAGRGVHDQLRADWATLLDTQRAPASVVFFGRGHGTANSVTLAGGRLRVSKDDPVWRGNAGWAGDGTVPALSAIPVELSDQPDQWRVLTVRHGPLGSVLDPIEQLRYFEGEPVPLRGGPLPDGPWLGLDVDDFSRTGAPLPVGVRLLPDGLAGTSCGVTLAALDGTPRPPWRASLTASGDGEWGGVLPPQLPGRYTLTVEVASVDGYGPIAADHTLIVLDTAQDGWSDSDIDEGRDR